MIKLRQRLNEACIPDSQRDAVARYMAVRLATAREEERSRVARDLHDDLGQKLALLSLELGQLSETIDGSGPVRLQLQNLQRHIEEISTDVHRLAYKLHPARLDNLGLVAALRSLCYELSESGVIHVEFHHKGSFAKLSRETNLCLFRIVQEALQNSTKHSGSLTARVFLVNTGKDIRLSVSDQGCGFDVELDAVDGGLGVTSMRERTRIAGGTIEIRSAPSSGTVIEVSIPPVRTARPDNDLLLANNDFLLERTMGGQPAGALPNSKRVRPRAAKETVHVSAIDHSDT